MWRGLYTAATGMVTEMNKADVIANNLSNVNSNGFKCDNAVVKEFEPFLLRRINDYDEKKKDVTTFKQFSLKPTLPVVGELGRGSVVDEIVTDHSQGSLITTGNPFDLAIVGNAYFSVQTAQGVRYTRDGNFYRSSNGNIVTADGENVLGRNGRPITIPKDGIDVAIGASGDVNVDGRIVGRIQLSSFNDERNQLEKAGSNMYRAIDGVVPANGADSSIQQGCLERSNSNVVDEMVNMIANYRAYEANSKAVITQDTLLDHAVNQVGRQNS